MTRKKAEPEPKKAPEAEAVPRGGDLVLDTRFGVFAFDPAQAIDMPQGLLGFTDQKRFGLVQVPQPGYQQFMLLQSLSDAETTFITMPLSLIPGLIKDEDLIDVCKTLEIDPPDLAVLLVVSIRKEDDRPQISVNLRAPVFLDTRHRTARQFVMSNRNYPVRHVLNAAPEGEAGKPAAEQGAAP